MTAVFCLLGIACALYGVTVMLVGSGTWFFTVWYALAVLFFAAAGMAHAEVWPLVPLVLRRVAQGLVVLCLGVLIVTQACALSSFNAQGEEDLDYIIVLGAQVHESGPSAVLRYRLDTACDYLQANPDTICIVSGGQGLNESVPEAHVMADYLIDRGVSEERVVQEDQSLTTYQNVRNSMQLFDSKTAHVGVVTNDFHVFRGVRISRKQGIEHVCGIAAPSKTWFLPNNLLRESMGIAKDFVKGNL